MLQETKTVNKERETINNTVVSTHPWSHCMVCIRAVTSHSSDQKQMIVAKH